MHSSGDSWPEAFEQCIRPLAEPQDRLHAFGLLEIDRDGFPTAREHVFGAPGLACEAIHANYLCAHIRQHHAAERTGANACQFNDPKSV
jgi:hypothetical protein